MTLGVMNPETYYYLRLYSDAVRAVETARSHPAVDPGRLADTGHSQGGVISVTASGLVRDVQAVMPDAPYMWHMRRATEITDEMPYQEIPRFLQMHRDKVETIFRTLSYFDGLNFAVRAKAPALFSVGLMDEACPPSTVYTAYNHYAGEKQVRVYTYNHHEAGGSHHSIEQIKYLQALWK